MNRIIPKIGAAVVTITVFLFAVFMIVDIPFGSYLVCMFLPIGYIMMVAGFHHESAEVLPPSHSVIQKALYNVTQARVMSGKRHSKMSRKQKLPGKQKR